MITDIDEIRDRISEIDSNIDELKRKASEAEGSIKTHMESLKKYDIVTDKEIEKFIKDSEKEAKRTKEKIIKLFKEIEDEYNSIT